MRRCCTICGRVYEGKTKRSQFCGSTCRNRHARGSAPPPLEVDTGLVGVTRTELETLGLVDSMIGRQALRLAEQMCVDTGSSLAALSRELRATMIQAAGAAPAAVDPLDELRVRREARRNAG